MADNKLDPNVEKRIIADTMAYRPIAEALNEAGYKTRLDVEGSFSSRSGSVTIFFEPITHKQRGELVGLLRDSGLYLDSRTEIAKTFPNSTRKGDSDLDELYRDKDVKGLVRLYTRPEMKDNKPTGTYTTAIDFGGLGLSFSPDLVAKGKDLNYESGQVLANAIRKAAGKPELPIKKTPEKMPTLAELEKAIPDLRLPPKPVDLAEVVKALNRQFGPHGYNFKLDNGAVVSVRELDGKEKETFMSVVAAMPESARLPLTAKYVNPNAPKDVQKFRLTLDPKMINEKLLDEFRLIDPDKMEKFFENERNTRPGNPDKQSQSTPNLLEVARSAVTFDVMSADARHLSLPPAPRQKNSNFRA